MMDWLVTNAQNRDVERQHLNKILQEIRATIDTLPTATSVQNTITTIIQRIPPSTPPFDITNLTVTLEGDVTGSGSSDANGDLLIQATLDPALAGVPEAPFDGQLYFRSSGTWLAADYKISYLPYVTTPGIMVLSDGTDPDGQVWLTRIVMGTTDQIDVANGDGIIANPTISLADIPNLGDGAFQVFYRDSKGRVSSSRAGTTDDVPEGTTNLFFTDERAQDAVGAILDGPMSVLLSYSPGQILATLDGDVASPGVYMFYVTDALGVKSWNPQPPIELLNINGYGAAGGYLRSNGAAWERVASIPKADVGLGNVDNTSDMDKPVSTAQAAAIAAAETITGVYTPTLTNVANVTASSANPVTYLRKDNVVILSGSISVTPTAAATDTRVRISIPIASNFTTGEQANGVCTIQTDTGTGNLTSNPTFDNIVVQVLPSTSGSPVRVFFMGSYEVL